jgi:hypothetical protein
MTAKHAPGPPPIAEENKRAAQSRIDAKIACMRSVLRLTDASVEMLAKLPQSPRQFNLWTQRKGEIGRGFPCVDLQQNAPQTLRKDLDRKGEVQGLINVLETLTGGKQISAREARLATAKAKLNLAEKLRAISEAKLASLFHENEQLRRQVHDLQASKKSAVARLNAELQDRDSRLEREKLRVAELTATISKTTPLRAPR